MKTGLFFVKPTLPEPPAAAAAATESVIVHVLQQPAVEMAGAMAEEQEEEGPEKLPEAPYKAMDARLKVRYAGPKVVVGSGKNAKYRPACAARKCLNRARQGEAGKMFCVHHRGGRRCVAQGCTSSANGNTGYCVTHGGGFRCEVAERHAQGVAPAAYYRLPEVPRNDRKRPRNDLSKLRCCLGCQKAFSFQ